MKAVFVPLNHYIFNFSKYDGRDFISRRIEKTPEKYREAVRNILLYMCMTLIMPFFCTYVLLGFIYVGIGIFYGRFKKNKIGFTDLTCYLTDQIPDHLPRSFNIVGRLHFFEARGYKLIIYYNSIQVPKWQLRRENFMKKILAIKMKFNAIEVVQANNSGELLEALKDYNIDAEQSVFFNDKYVEFSLQNNSREIEG